MPTARDFISLALKEAGVTGVGQTPLDEDINDCFTLLDNMLAQWRKRRWIVPNLIDISAVGNDAISNLIGPGQYYNTARPDKIQAAYFKHLNGGGGSNDVSYALKPIWSYEQYSLIGLKNLNAWPSYYFYDNQFPYGNVFIWPVPSSNYEIHLILKGPLDFVTQLNAGSIVAGGALYTDGVYPNIEFITVSGFGNSGTADFSVAGGIITGVVIANGGSGYRIGDILSVDPTLIGGTGAGFLWKVDKVVSSLDAEFTMPEEYREAIHYNLVIRITAMYSKPANPIHGKLAVIALNTIKNSNFQISKLRMPSSLRFGRNGGGGFYIFNADQF